MNIFYAVIAICENDNKLIGTHNTTQEAQAQADVWSSSPADESSGCEIWHVDRDAIQVVPIQK